MHVHTCVCMCVPSYQVAQYSRYNSHLKHICCIYEAPGTSAKTILRNGPKIKSFTLYIYIQTVGLLQCSQLGARKHVFTNLERPQGKMSRVEIGSFLQVLKIPNQPAAVMRLESSIDFKGTSGCKAIKGVQIYPVRVECKLEPLDMRN